MAGTVCLDLLLRTRAACLCRAFVLVSLLGFLMLLPAYAARTYSVLYSFAGPDGANPYANVISDDAGNLYGTTYDGGDLSCTNGVFVGCGAVFMLDSSGKETVLHAFAGGDDGAYPFAGLVRDQAGNLYGTTMVGGDTNCNRDLGVGCGVVYKVTPTGTFSVLYIFHGGQDGAYPVAGLILDANGNLYGTSSNGGNTNDCSGLGCGVVFMLNGLGKETVLYAFTGGADGSEPDGDLVRDAAGNLYGTTTIGGIGGCPQGCGVVFKLNTIGKLIVLHSFGIQPDGNYPNGGLVFDNAGNMYGTTFSGGLYGDGTVFKLHWHSETVLYSFKGSPDDAAGPNGRLVRDQAGNLYGTSEIGGRLKSQACGQGCGTVFQVTTSGQEKVIHYFNLLSLPALGGRPLGGVTLDSKGNVYGTTTNGGDPACKNKEFVGCGVVFKITP
jgi:uncharacterized repeat protein (TIGR03803 family)